ncbi:MAG: secretin N-terminal domain-containing protein [Oceanipulchritudo sp.]
MTDQFHPFPHLKFFSSGLVAAILLVGATLSPAQDEELTGPPPTAAPDFIPPPPPDFSPPPPPGSASPTPRPVSRPVNRMQPTQDELLQQPSELVDRTDPMMAETVGLIRIPEMGTNEVLEMLENFTGKPILRQQTLPSVKITFYSQDALTRGEAITAIESLLALNGIAITTLGEKFLKAVPSAVINAQVPRNWEGTTLDAEPSMMIYEKIFELDFLTTEEAAAILQPLMSQGAPIAFDKSNFILVTDALVNLQRIERLLPILDKPADLKTEMLFFELQNIKADEVTRRLQQIIAGPLRRQLENNTTVDSDERTNQLLVFTHPSNTGLIRKLIERLDIDVAPTTATKVYSIRYADATELVGIIEQIVSGQRQVRTETGGDAGTPAAQAARARAAAITRQNNQAVAAARAEASNLQFSDFLTIVPDERANTIVASGTQNDLTYLEQLIEQIDTLLAQVRIEVVITDVSLTESQQRGIDQFGFSYTGTGFDIDFENPDNTWTASPGSFYGISSDFGWVDGNFSMDVVLNRIAENDNIKVLSAPTIVTTHNKEATVSVGQEVPVVTQITTTDTGGTNNVNFVDRSQVQYRDVKLELKVTPLIGSDGVVQMEIDQQVQDLGTPVDVGNQQPAQPTINTRSATSYVSVMDGGLIALGGLQRLSSENTRGKMAVLGSIPVLGNLFKSNDTTTNRNELLIFIRPTIIRTTESADRDANKLIDKMQGSKEIRDYLEEGTFREREAEETETEEKDIRRRNFRR